MTCALSKKFQWSFLRDFHCRQQRRPKSLEKNNSTRRLLVQWRLLLASIDISRFLPFASPRSSDISPTIWDAYGGTTRGARNLSRCQISEELGEYIFEYAAALCLIRAIAVVLVLVIMPVRDSNHISPSHAGQAPFGTLRYSSSRYLGPSITH